VVNVTIPGTFRKPMQEQNERVFDYGLKRYKFAARLGTK
jgi:hypothetical protein